MIAADQFVSFMSGRNRTRFVARVFTPVLLLVTVLFATVFYFAVSPFIVTALRPEYSTLQKYSNVQMCSDASTKALDTTVFQPTACSAIDNSKTIGCVYIDAMHYKAPGNATNDQSIVCPTVTSEHDGVSNPSVPVFAVNEHAYQLGAMLLGTFVAIIVYVVVRYMLHRRKNRA